MKHAQVLVGVFRGSTKVSICRFMVRHVCRSYASSDDLKAEQSEFRLQPPKMPEAYECCGNGCNDCVWDTYFKKQAEYLKAKKVETLPPKMNEYET